LRFFFISEKVSRSKKRGIFLPGREKLSTEPRKLSTGNLIKDYSFIIISIEKQGPWGLRKTDRYFFSQPPYPQRDFWPVDKKRCLWNPRVCGSSFNLEIGPHFGGQVGIDSPGSVYKIGKVMNRNTSFLSPCNLFACTGFSLSKGWSWKIFAARL